MKRTISLCLTVALFWAALPCAFASDNTVRQVETGKTEGSVMTYHQYEEHYADCKKGNSSVEITSAQITKTTGPGVKLPSDSAGQRTSVWLGSTAEKSTVQYTFELPEEAVYSLAVRYEALEGIYDFIDFSLKINGAFPFQTASEVRLNKVWENENKERVYDNRENELRSNSKQVTGVQTAWLIDREGVTNEPYRFHFEKGTNTIEISPTRADFLLDALILSNPEQPAAYQEPTGTAEASGKDRLLLEAEQMSLKSDPSLTPESDRSSAATSPSDPAKTRYNMLGGSKWSTPGQWAEWSFYIETPGYYKIGMRTLQNYQRGYDSTRRISLDGKVPFSEMAAVKFPYNGGWYTKVLGDDEPYLFYLDKGEHTIRLDVIPGDNAALCASLYESVSLLNKWYTSIIMATGTTPDTYRDYDMEAEVPGITEAFGTIREMLQRDLDRMNGKRDSGTANIERLIVQLDDFIKDIATLPERLSTFSSNISGLAAWVLELNKQPLGLDYIEILPIQDEFSPAGAGFFEAIGFRLGQFISSFVEDYNNLGSFDENGVKPLSVWVGSGRDQALVIKDMVDNRFVSQHQMNVNIKLSTTGLMEATFAGRGPDVALFVDNIQPVTFAVRNASVNLADFPDFDEVAARFSDSSLEPNRFNGGVYGLPLTAEFMMMFYRTDIFSELGIQPPDTWAELYQLLPVIQRKNMNIGLPAVTTALADIFNVLLFQKGGTYYNEDQSAAALDSMAAIDAFKEWTEFYTQYSVPVEQNFYNRFRTGETPIGIAAFSMYNQLKVGAPELNGLWKMVPLPATVNENGEKNRSSPMSGLNAIIIRSDQKTGENAWEFLKWFTNADAQVEYGRTLESLLGIAARYNTANKEAFTRIPWTASEQQLILEQWDNTVGIPQTPAGYYVSRSLYNAFRKVTNSRANPRETLYRYTADMNLEITRKREEFALK